MMGSGTQAVYGTVGYPGITIGYLRGLSDTLDAGGRFSLNYGGEGVPQATAFGIKLAGDFKLKLDIGLPYPLVLRALPGINLYFPTGFTIFNIALPVGLDVGIPVAPNVLVNAGVQVPWAIGFWSLGFTSMQIPFLFGGGVELKTDSRLSLHAQVHLGPYVGIVFGGLSQTFVAFDTLLGVTYRLP
ncbi:MAG TPA: hypothetical protein VND93_21920 [Myxococcales bacterium]|jgi:hypothetical protein|nr:hypothetical protein [Myxococcales bacterium]